MLRTSAISLLAFSVLAHFLSPLPAAPGDPADLENALLEMDAIEAQISERLADQAVNKQRIEGVQRDLKTAEGYLTGSDELRQRGKRAIKDLERSVARDLAAMDEAKAAAQSQLDESKRGLETAVPLLLHQLREHGAAEPATLAVALAAARHRQAGNLAVEQLLRLESRRTSRADDGKRISELSRRHAAFAGLKLDELRARHRELANRLGSLHASAEETQSDILSLGSRRRSLNELVARLSAGEKVQPEAQVASAAAPSRAPAPPIEEMAASRSSALPADIAGEPTLAEVPYDEEQRRLPLGTRQGNGAPTMELELEPVPAEAAADGDRKVFWRARPAGVRAVARGAVLFSGAFAGYRHLLVVDCGEGWVCVYGNMTASPLLEGDTVGPGDPIGEYQAELAGRAEPFFFEVRRNGKTVPAGTLPGLASGWADQFFTELQ